MNWCKQTLLFVSCHAFVLVLSGFFCAVFFAIKSDQFLVFFAFFYASLKFRLSSLFFPGLILFSALVSTVTKSKLQTWFALAALPWFCISIVIGFGVQPGNLWSYLVTEARFPLLIIFILECLVTGTLISVMQNRLGIGSEPKPVQ